MKETDDCKPSVKDEAPKGDNMKKALLACKENIKEVEDRHPEMKGKFWCLYDIDRALIANVDPKDFSSKPPQDGFAEDHPNL